MRSPIGDGAKGAGEFAHAHASAQATAVDGRSGRTRQSYCCAQPLQLPPRRGTVARRR